MASYLTARQKEILEFIHAFRREKGLAPTHREICERFGFSSYGTAYKHLKLLSEKGFLKRDRHLEIAGGAIAPQSYVYRLTEAGHARAAEFSDQSQYVGSLPVPLSQYKAYMDAFHRAAAPHVTRQAVRDAFQHLVLSDRVLDQLGPAIAARHSLFIYGPPGNGKTKIAQTIGVLLPGEIAIPHAIAVDRDIIRVFDPMTGTNSANER